MFKRLAPSHTAHTKIIRVGDEAVDCQVGESLAASLLVSGWPKPDRILAPNELAQRQAWNYFCGIGICGECRVLLDDGRSVAACQQEGISDVSAP